MDVCRQGLNYLLTGDLSRLRWPTAGERPLWQHTCCELFVGTKGSSAYREFNFSPSGDWAAYEFDDYRKAAEKVSGTFPWVFSDVAITTRKKAAQFELRAELPIPRGALLGISAVIEETDGSISYWALRHPPGKPDFHHREAFALELA